MRLYLIRHPRPDIGPGICYGSTDLPVSATEQALTLSTLVPALPTGVPVFSSPLLRCMGLAEQLAVALEAGAVSRDVRLAELHFGEWEGRTWDAIARAEIDAWASDPAGYRPGGGESVLEAAARIREFLASLLARRCGSAIVVCHAGTIRLILACRNGGSLETTAAEAAAGAHALAYGGMTIVDL